MTVSPTRRLFLPPGQGRSGNGAEVRNRTAKRFLTMPRKPPDWQQQACSLPTQPT